MTYGSLFSGCGGADLGLEQAGLVCKWQCEIDRQARSVLKRHWPDVPVFEDVCKVGVKNLEPVDVIVGGFPCQDLSVAGRGAGLDGERSGLFFELHRVLAEVRPEWFLIENVPGLLSNRQGRDFAIALRRLAELGYRICGRVLDSQYHNLAQRRERVFLVGHLGDGRSAEVLFDAESLCWDSAPKRSAGKDISGTLGGGSGVRGWQSSLDTCGAFIPEISGTLAASGAGTDRPAGQGNELDFVIAHAVTANMQRQDASVETFIPECADTLTAGGHPNSNAPGRRREDDSNIVAHTLRGEGFDASEDGTGRGTPLVPVCVAENQRGELRLSDISAQLTTGGGKPGQGYPAAMVHDGKEWRVRRLTPRECERLQGFPDDWTRYYDSGKEIKDGPRYRMIGNAVSVPVAKRIGERLIIAHEKLTVERQKRSTVPAATLEAAKLPN